MLKFFKYPAANLPLVIPVVLALGFILGLSADTSSLKMLIMPMTYLMIYPTMIGYDIRQAIDKSHMKIVSIASLINFIIIPAIAFAIGSVALRQSPELFAGLIMISLFPTSGMTISWTMISKGNVPAAVKLTAISLLSGSILAPVYLKFILGKVIDFSVFSVAITVIQVVFLPMIAGYITYKIIERKKKVSFFKERIKPLLSSFSVWPMLVVIFSSISMKAKMLLKSPELIFTILLVLITFYLVNFLISTYTSRMLLNQQDGYALVFGTGMRNLSIALGIAASSFGPETALVVTIAFILQVQLGAWYGALSRNNGWLRKNGSQEIAA